MLTAGWMWRPYPHKEGSANRHARRRRNLSLHLQKGAHHGSNFDASPRAVEQGQACRAEAPPIQAKGIWAIRVRLQLRGRVRDLALFNLGIDSKLRACDLAKLRVRDISSGERAAARAKVMQQKTGQPVQFEMTGPTRPTWDGQPFATLVLRAPRGGGRSP